MDSFADTKLIFEQLADIDGAAGVQTMSETHDAWVHNAAVMREISVAMRAQLARAGRPEAVRRRIEKQRVALAGLVVERVWGEASAG